MLLPAELRNQIWVYVLSDGPVIVLPAKRSPTQARGHGCLTLLRVCRQVYEETRVLAYRLRCFRLTAPLAFTSGFNRDPRCSSHPSAIWQ